MATNPLDTGGEGHLRRPPGGGPTQQIHGRGAQQAHRGTGGMGLQHLAILAEAIVCDMKQAVLDPPVITTQCQHPSRAGQCGGEAGHEVAGPGADLARGHLGHLGGDLRHLAEARQRAVARQVGGDADRALLEAAVPLAHLDRIGRAGLAGEQEFDIGEEGGLVFLSRRT